MGDNRASRASVGGSISRLQYKNMAGSRNRRVWSIIRIARPVVVDRADAAEARSTKKVVLGHVYAIPAPRLLGAVRKLRASERSW
jgi:hypothetical protein